MFLAFLIIDQSDHFAKAIAFAWAVAFERWPIFQIVSFLEYLVFFRAVFAQNKFNVPLEWFFACFWHF